jgi:hypothetical protein
MALAPEYTVFGYGVIYLENEILLDCYANLVSHIRSILYSKYLSFSIFYHYKMTTYFGAERGIILACEVEKIRDK